MAALNTYTSKFQQYFRENILGHANLNASSGRLLDNYVQENNNEERNRRSEDDDDENDENINNNAPAVAGGNQ
jgi:hypothetical protein